MLAARHAGKRAFSLHHLDTFDYERIELLRGSALATVERYIDANYGDQISESGADKLCLYHGGHLVMTFGLTGVPERRSKSAKRAE